MTLNAGDLKELAAEFRPVPYDRDDGSWMLVIRSPRRAVNLFWAATEGRVRELVRSNPQADKLHTAVFPSTEGWAVGIATDELLPKNKEDLARTATCVLALCADIPELAGIEAALVDNARRDLVASQLHDDIAAGKLPPVGRAG